MPNYKPLPIGVEDFKEIIDKNYYFVDKTLMIKELLDNQSKVALFTRPRRFGKTLNVSMIQRFFEKTDENHSYLFDGLKISEYPDCMQYQGQYPVISITLKGMKQGTYEESFLSFKNTIIKEFSKYEYLLKSEKLAVTERERFYRIYTDTADDREYNFAIALLSDCLYKYYSKKVIILIDEYDVPLENAFARGFYSKMIDLIRSAFESALKTNPSLEFAVLTGCLRVSRESIFTGLNNLNVYSIVNPNFSDAFGFTQKEIDSLLVYYKLESKSDEIKHWYDGYLFSETEIYNPWSVINYISNALVKNNYACQSYWSNTSSNTIIKHLIEEADEDTKATIEDLMNDIPVESLLYEDVTYGEMDVNKDYIWSFLLFTGYLKVMDTRTEGSETIYKMVIPNTEVKNIYKNTIAYWFKDQIKSEKRDYFFEAILNKDAEKVNDHIQFWLAETISYYDEKESYYHGFLAGLLTGFKGYRVTSNRESGNGRYDLFVKSRVGKNTAVIFEFKLAPTEDELEKYADFAIQQIEEKKYEMELKAEHYKKIIKYGIAFCEKVCYTKLSPFSD